jgi:hypothetical protein
LPTTPRNDRRIEYKRRKAVEAQARAVIDSTLKEEESRRKKEAAMAAARWKQKKIEKKNRTSKNKRGRG